MYVAIINRRIILKFYQLQSLNYEIFFFLKKCDNVCKGFFIQTRSKFIFDIIWPSRVCRSSPTLRRSYLVATAQQPVDHPPCDRCNYQSWYAHPHAHTHTNTRTHVGTDMYGDCNLFRDAASFSERALIFRPFSPRHSSVWWIPERLRLTFPFLAASHVKCHWGRRRHRYRCNPSPTPLCRNSQPLLIISKKLLWRRLCQGYSMLMFNLMMMIYESCLFVCFSHWSHFFFFFVFTLSHLFWRKKNWLFVSW